MIHTVIVIYNNNINKLINFLGFELYLSYNDQLYTGFSLCYTHAHCLKRIFLPYESVSLCLTCIACLAAKYLHACLAALLVPRLDNSESLAV